MKGKRQVKGLDFFAKFLKISNDEKALHHDACLSLVHIYQTFANIKLTPPLAPYPSSKSLTLEYEYAVSRLKG